MLFRSSGTKAVAVSCVPAGPCSDASSEPTAAEEGIGTALLLVDARLANQPCIRFTAYLCIHASISISLRPVI